MRRATVSTGIRVIACVCAYASVGALTGCEAILGVGSLNDRPEDAASGEDARSDAEARDSGTHETGARDARSDIGTHDSGLRETGPHETGSADTGAHDAQIDDTGLQDVNHPDDTSTHDAGVDSGACKTGSIECSGNIAQTCSSGVFGDPVTCTGQTCVTNTGCTGVCAPMQTQCSGNGVETCTASGAFGNAVACSGTTPLCAGGVCVPGPPQQISPLSTSRATSLFPTFRWKAPNSPTVTIDICSTRACATVLSSTAVTASSYKLTTALPAAGVYYWRLHPGTVTSVSSPVWEFTVGPKSATGTAANGKLVDTSWGTTLDINGDGCADIAIGASSSGSVFWAAGSPTGPGSLTAVTGGPTTNGSDFGQSVASAGDLNGDGYADLIVGASQTVGATGSVYIYLGGPAGLPATPSATLVGPDGANGVFGSSVASAGDLNGDGYADILVGETSASTYTGKVFVYFGGASNGGTITLTAGPILLGQAGTYTEFGQSVAGVGDVNGDGYADFVIGESGSGPASTLAGTAYLYLGGATFPTTPTALNVTGTTFFGYSVAGAGDVNGDGFADVLVGAYVTGSGTTAFTGGAYLYYGSATGLGAATAVDDVPGKGSQFGVSVASAGDVNGDGYADIIVGADTVTSTSLVKDTGAAYVYLGSSAGLVNTPTADPNPQPFSAAVGDATGAFVGSAGNVTCGVYEGILVSAPNHATNGAVYYYPGGAGGLPQSPPITFTAPTGSTYFGASVFGSTN